MTSTELMASTALTTTASPPAACRHPRRPSADQLATKIESLKGNITATEHDIEAAVAAQRGAAARALLDDGDTEAVVEQERQAKAEAEARRQLDALRLALAEGRRLHAGAAAREREEKFAEVAPLARRRLERAAAVDVALRNLADAIKDYQESVRAMMPYHQIDPAKLPAVALRPDVRLGLAIRMLPHGIRALLADSASLIVTQPRSLADSDAALLHHIIKNGETE